MRRGLFTALLALAAGCAGVLGLDDVDYADAPAPANAQPDVEAEAGGCDGCGVPDVAVDVGDGGTAPG